MTKDEVLTVFKQTAALLDGHFRLTSGLHSPQYFQCALVLQDPVQAQKLCWEIAAQFMTDKIDVVIAPAVGGIVVAQEVARLVSARAIFAERENGEMILRRGFTIKPKEKVLVVEDVVTTGGSIKEVIELVQSAGADLKGVGFLVDRSQGKVDFPVRKFSVLEMEVITYEPESCPLCKQGIPVVKPGSRPSSQI
ncbi:orotate phosphoribosyltransferase [candidate division KSB1 bacterium]|nr:orotate phosphoribosyltransferase [candidate division KSB1 bacterium]